MPIETIVSAVPALATILADRATDLARAAVADGRCFVVALPGGSVAEAFFPTLALARIDWDRVECFWGDERSVPPDDPQSNYRLAAQLLFKHVNVDPGRVHRMPADAVDLDAAAAAYEVALRTILGPSPRFDMVLLGAGPDGHVCSLFPGHPALDESSRLVVAVTDSPKPPPRRLTLTFPALAGASLLVVAAFGDEKSAVIREALENPDSGLPVARVARLSRQTLFLLDAEAAGFTHLSSVR
ncbi:MAG: 6-phosphogluconolactonase [Acidobacteria bacterium]|nr:MAG: 6-phosphogluconolactonase [Acidobacteriota bacterium]